MKCVVRRQRDDVGAAAADADRRGSFAVRRFCDRWPRANEYRPRLAEALERLVRGDLDEEELARGAGSDLDEWETMLGESRES